MSESTVRDQLRELVERRRITPRQAELLVGHIGCSASGIPTHPKAAQRRRRELRRLGLALALDGQDGERVDVPLGDVLDDLLASAGWDG
jgi:hypothetical protein